MASLAGLLQQQGHRVTGSDAGVYPPMSDQLAAMGIAVMQPYAEKNLDPRPDLRKGADGGSAGGPKAPDDGWMPPPGSEALQATRSELRAAWADAEQIRGELRKLAEGYGISDELPAP